MKLRFTPRATADLVDISDYLYAHNPAAARRVRSAIYRSLQSLLLFPRLGRRQRTSGVRKLVTSPYRYLVYYAIDEVEGEIVVLSVVHPARRRAHTDA